jgi:ribosomal-protein-alanine N-acetyltransferase
MNPDNLTLKVNASTEKDIQSHLFICSRQFSPPLGDRVEIGEYSRKLRRSALTFEAWSNDSLVGLVAAYINAQDKSCFITNTSVLAKYTGQGVATRLLAACLVHVRAANVETVSLEVSKDSRPAIRLYEKFGFRVVDDRGNFLKMQCNQPGLQASWSEGSDS